MSIGPGKNSETGQMGSRALTLEPPPVLLLPGR